MVLVFAESKKNMLNLGVLQQRGITGIKEFYSNNFHLLEYFIILFENKAHDLISIIHPSKLAAFHSPFDLSLPGGKI